MLTRVAITALLMSLSGYAVAQVASDKLAAPESFTAGDTAQQSAAMFTELGKVLTHPRCMNCHPASDSPRQGDMRRLHQPPVERGVDGFGTATMRCSTCHQKENFDPGRVPGHPEWHLAPREMAWEGKTLREICVQIKDRERNGGRSPEDLVHHIGDDTLVGWAWAPGFGRTPAPGTQKQAKALVDAWVKTGSECP
jgi:cytochrome c5